MIGKITHGGLHDKGENAAYGSEETHLSQGEGKRGRESGKQRADKRIVKISGEVDKEEKENHLDIDVF